MTVTQEQPATKIKNGDYQRLFLATLTPRSAPPLALISHWERTGPHVLSGDDDEGLLLCGPLGVNYYVERADADAIYLRRWDVPEVR